MLGIKNNTTILGIKTACLFGCLMMSLTAHAELNCDPRSGKIIQANNKKEYCISLNTMNWWTSLGWCESIGGTLLEYPKDCQCDNDECLRTDCPALATQSRTGYIWTKTPALNDQAYIIDPERGIPFLKERHLTNFYALCKNK